MGLRHHGGGAVVGARVRSPRAALIAAAAALIIPCAGARGDGRERALILHSYHNGLARTDDVTAGIASALARLGRDVELYVEYMDTRRCRPTPEYLAGLAAALRLKYRDMTPEVIVSADDDAFTFLRRHHGKLFPGVPVVFCGVSGFKPEMLKEHPAFTGVVESKDMAGTLALALRLHPGRRHVITISDDTASGRADRSLVMEACKRKRRLTVEDLSGGALSKDEMLSRLSQASNSIVMFVSFWRDATGRMFRVANILARRRMEEEITIAEPVWPPEHRRD